MKNLPALIFMLSLYFMQTALQAAHPGDTHYTDAGFFDLHYCNWPNRDPFYLALFSTTRYEDLKAVEIFTPQGQRVGGLDLRKYRVSRRKDKPEKHIFISHLGIHDSPMDGWFEASIVLQDNTKFTAKDFVIHKVMPRAQAVQPADGAEDVAMPKKLRWDPVPGAKYYKVYIRDMWDGEKLIYESKLLPEPEMVLPKDLLKPGGLYTWRIHARDVNEHVLLGDFNHGSLTAWMQFSIADI